MTQSPSAAERHAEQTRRLRGLGLRATPQRVLVLDALSSRPGHLTADEILRLVGAQYPAINLATVYRTLDTLTTAGLVTQTDLGEGSAHYELAGGERHHHLVCQRCGAVTEVPDTHFAPLRDGLLRDYGFRTTSTHLAVFGVCRACAASEQDADANRPS